MTERKHTPEMTGFYGTDPRAEDYETPINLFEIMSALQATSVILSETVGDGTNNVSRNEGLANAVRVLVALLSQRDTGETVIKKPAPRPSGPSKRKRRPRPASVVSLVRPSEAAAGGQSRAA